MTSLILLVFVVGYFCIAIEGVVKVNKAAVALFMAVVCWALYMLGSEDYIAEFYSQPFRNYLKESAGSGNPAVKFLVENVFSPHVADACETILFLMGAMTIVEVVDSNGGFRFVNRRLQTSDPCKLLWRVVALTFVLSALLDNMTTAIVMVMVLKRLVANRKQRMLYSCIVILAANSGGAFSPIGDVTTIMLWIKGCVSTTGIIKSLFIPAVVSVVVPALFVMRMLKGKVCSVGGTVVGDDSNMPEFSRNVRIAIFCIGVFGLMLVPVFRTLTGLPPFVGVMGVLAVLWIMTEIIIRKNRRVLSHEAEARVSNIMHKIDMSTILFFLGILLAVGALQETGTLSRLGVWLNTTFSNVYVVNMLIGMISSIVDNVPLVASAMGMYAIQPDTAVGMMENFCQDGAFWNLLAYCAGTGGSILIIGSAAGVVVMGLENISFGWYLKRFTWLALAGYFSGIAAYWLMNLI